MLLVCFRTTMSACTCTNYSHCLMNLGTIFEKNLGKNHSVSSSSQVTTPIPIKLCLSINKIQLQRGRTAEQGRAGRSYFGVRQSTFSWILNHSVIHRLCPMNLGFLILFSKCVGCTLSRPSVNRFVWNFGGILTSCSVKSPPNFSQTGAQTGMKRYVQRNLWRQNKET